MKKKLLLILMSLLPVVARAYDAYIDGIYYNFYGNGATVTYLYYHSYTNERAYSGAVVIPASVTYEGKTYSLTNIDVDAFAYCSGLTSVTIPNSVKYIGNEAFLSCSSLTSVTIPNSVTLIGNNAFVDCSGLRKVIVPDIAAWCSIIFGDGIANPLYYAHHLYVDEETEITDLVIPNSVTSISSLAFQSCSGLTSVTIPNSVTSIGQSAFSGCSGLTSVTIPNSVTNIGKQTFFYCRSLTSVNIPNSVTSIGERAFSGCTSLTSITIGSGVRSIDRSAFAYCQELTDVYCYAENVPSTYSSDVFEGSDIKYATLHVPEGSIDAYKATSPWSKFGTIVALDGDTPEPPKPEKCATPSISYANGKLKFSCETEGAECVTVITDSDIKTHYGNEISLTATYNLTVYATKTDYENSDTIQATLCWIDAEPKTEGIVAEDAVHEIKTLPVLIQSHGGTISVQGLDAGTLVTIYSTDGKQQGSNVVVNGATTIPTSLQPGSIAVVKIGERSIKVLLK